MSLTAKLVALGLVLLALAAGAWKILHDADRAGYQRAQAEFSEARILTDRAREQRYAARQAVADKEARHGQELIAQLETDLAGSRAAGERLRSAIRAAVARGRETPDPTGAGAGQPASDPIGVLGRLYAESDERAGALAGYADALRIAGQTCERYSDGLMRPRPSSMAPARRPID